MAQPIEELLDDVERVGERRRGKGAEEAPAVSHRPEPRIEHGQHAAIVAMPQQPAEPLLERENRQRDLVLAKCRAAARW